MISMEVGDLLSLLNIWCRKFKKRYALKNQRLKVTQLEKARFIKVNELKLYEGELF